MIKISGVHIEHPETDGIVIEDGRLVSATGCRIDKPETDGVRVGALG
jgi:hypothetical protein